MAMIEGIDGTALLNAFRQGRQDRMAFDKAKIAADRQKEVQGLIGQLLPGKAAGGVAAQMGVPALPGVISGYGGGTFDTQGNQVTPPDSAGDHALVPQAIGAVSQDKVPSVATASAAPAMVPQVPQRAAYDPDILRKLTIMDPEMGDKIASAFKTMDEANLKQHQAKNDALGLAAHWLSRYPPQQRQQMLQIVTPQLLAAGWTQQEIANANLTDDGLHAYEGMAIDFDKMVDNELAQREFEAGKTVSVAPGGSVAVVRPTLDGNGNVTGNNAQYIIGGGGTGTAPSSGVPKAAADYLRQHPELRDQFDQKYGAGSANSILGGGGGDATGGFPAVQ